MLNEWMQVLDERRIVSRSGKRLHHINELEYIEGYIYANVYLDRRIMKIDFDGGAVVEELDGLRMLQKEQSENGLKRDEVLNGIAYHKESGNLVVTGKNWGNFYQAEISQFLSNDL